MWEISSLADLDLWGISFHAVVVFGLGKDLFSIGSKTLWSITKCY